MCAREDGAREVQRCAVRLQVACARLKAMPVAAETPGWAWALLARLDEVPKSEDADRNRFRPG
ncbi:MAG: hypothetical protein JWO81_565 [Alphaproteobacteria bacterium]|nr:hypothetical protein [Alphaproteobacteria bacterium]